MAHAQAREGIYCPGGTEDGDQSAVRLEALSAIFRQRFSKLTPVFINLDLT